MREKKVLIIGGLIALGALALATVAVFNNSGSTPAVATENMPATSESTQGAPVSGVPVVGVPVAASFAPSAGTSLPNTPPARKATMPAKVPRKTSPAFQSTGEICVDARTGRILSGKDQQAKGAPASVTKLMTLFVVLDAVERKKMALDDVVTASARAQSMGGTQIYLAAGERCVARDLLYALIVESANDAAVALAEHLCNSVEEFVELMNKEAAELGMANTKFCSPHGLPPSKKQRAAGMLGDMTTAEDLAKLGVALVTRFPGSLEFCSARTKEFPENSMRKKPLGMRNHNKLLSLFAGCDGLKTGWINAGASIVATASRGNVRVISVVLCGQVKNKKGEVDSDASQLERNQRAAELMYEGFRALDVLQYEPTPYKK